MDIVKDYEKFLKENYDKERAENERRYLYSELKHYGISYHQRKAYSKKYKTELGKMNKREAFTLAKKLWNEPVFEKRGLALGILNHKKDELNNSDIPLIEKIMRESQGWALLDNSIIPLMPILLEKDKNNYKLLHKWIKDDDYWVRRSALLAQLLLFRKNKGDKQLFFDFAESQFDESWINKLYKDKKDLKDDSFTEQNLLKSRAKFFIRKAIGWTLREMSAKDPQIVYKFLRKNKNKMSGLSFREGSRNLPQHLKDKL